MNKTFKSEFDEPLWTVPVSVSERLKSRQKNSEYTAFIFCGVYCAVAVIFLLIFGVAALLREEPVYANVIFGFATTTTVSYVAIWLIGPPINPYGQERGSTTQLRCCEETWKQLE